MRKTELFLKNHSLEIRSWKRQGYLTSADALVFLRSLRDTIADVVFLDPPFNLRKDYGSASSLENADSEFYASYMRRLILEAVRILKPGGALFLYHLPYWASRLSDELHRDLQFRHWIAIAMKNAFVRGKHLYPAHYALLYYTKGNPAHFRRPRFPPARCRTCKSLIRDYGGYTNIIRQKGVNLSDFWDDLSPVRHKSKKLWTANQLPLELTDRIVKIAGARMGTLVDPFAGTGTSLVSAKKARMFFVGNDLSRQSVGICVSRLNGARK